jgi:hypothetical protein
MTCSRRRRSVLSLTLVVLGSVPIFPRVALGDESPSARAEALFHEGRAAERSGDLDAACAQYAASEAVLATPGASLNLAVCDERAGRLASAHARYAKLASTLPSGDPRVEIARTSLAMLESRVSRLLFMRGSGTPLEVVVTVDGTPIVGDVFDKAHVLDPGRHVIVARAAGHIDHRQEVVVAAGKTRSIKIDLSQPPKPRADRAQSRSLARRRMPAPAEESRTAGWIMLGAGGASMAVGAVAGLLVLDRKAEMKEHCDSDAICDDEGLRAADSGQKWSAVSTIGFGVGVAATGVGVFLLTKPRGKQSAALVLQPRGVVLRGRL